MQPHSNRVGGNGLSNSWFAQYFNGGHSAQDVQTSSMRHWREPPAPYQPSIQYVMDQDPMRQFLYPNVQPVAFDNRSLHLPRMVNQLSARVGGAMEVVAEKQVKLDELVKGLAEQQSKMDGAIRTVFAQQAVMTHEMKAVIDQQTKTDATVRRLADGQHVMAEQMTKSDGVLHTLLSQQSQMLSAIQHLRRPSTTDHVPACRDIDAVGQSPSTSNKEALVPQENEPKSSVQPDTDVKLIDEWHDGSASLHFTWDEIAAISLRRKEAFMVHWAMDYPGGRHRKSAKTETSSASVQVSRRICLGVMACSTGHCKWVDRPQTKKEGRARQLTQRCHCGVKVVHISCDVVHEFRESSNGVSFDSTKFHQHVRPPPLHLTRKQKHDLKSLSKLNPTATPSSYISGVPGPEGELTTAMNISGILINRDRLLYEMKKEKNRKPKEEGLFGPFAEFVETHPNFIIDSTFADIIVITVQTEFMATQIYRSMCDSNLSEPVNGAVSDAAHKYFRELNAVLMATTLYTPIVRRWMPALMSYMNGQTTAHYKCHFKTYFRVVHRICADYDIPFLEKYFLMVRQSQL